MTPWPPAGRKSSGRKDFSFHPQPEPFSPAGQDDSAPILVFAQLAQPGRDVSAQIDDLQVGPNPAELSLAPDASGRDRCPRRQGR